MSNSDIAADLLKYGIKGNKEIIYNPDYDRLFDDELNEKLNSRERGTLTELGAVKVDTGRFTGRSPKDKYIVFDETSKDTVWWRSETAKSSDNKPIEKDVWDHALKIAADELSSSDIYVMDVYCGANPDSRLNVRFVMEVAWQAHFVKNMFIRPEPEDLENFKPDFVMLNAAKTSNPAWEEQNLHSEVFVFFNLTERMGLIGGSWYGGEMKKGIFSMMNYYLPLRGIAAMHCSANVGVDGDTAIFFGLSGTGKTTLSTDPNRALIGDDEHGWDDDGIFNFEGGCYAKCIDLSSEKEPEIYHAIRRDALLENVIVDSDGKVDFEDATITENTRVSYPITHIDNIVRPVSKSGHPKKVIFLSADAFGVMPPVSRLDPEQTKYHFLSGFTAKLAGTELGVTKPVPAFSACFGAAFLTLHPTKYGEELVKRMEAAGSTAYLVNTGWNGTGKRISLKDTRQIINAILAGDVDDVETKRIPYFNFEIPITLDGINDTILDPRHSYDNPDDWDKKARDLAAKFIENFKQFTDTDEGKRLVEAGPKIY